jgi:hypothetical protein
MGLKRKQILMRQKEYFEHKLQDRLSFLSGKGSKSPNADKDTLVRKFKANIRAVNKRLRLNVDNEKKTKEPAKIKAEMKSAHPKAPEGGKSQETTESFEEGKATRKKKVEETREEPAGKVKADK